MNIATLSEHWLKRVMSSPTTDERQRIVQIDVQTLAQTRVGRVNAKPSTLPSIRTALAQTIRPGWKESLLSRSTASSASLQSATLRKGA